MKAKQLYKKESLVCLCRMDRREHLLHVSGTVENIFCACQGLRDCFANDMAPFLLFYLCYLSAK